MALTKITGEGVGDVDSLTVDTNTLVVDAANNRVGIGTASPSVDLEIASTAGSIKLSDTDGSDKETIIKHSGGTFFLQARDGSSNAPIVFGGNGGGSFDEHLRVLSGGGLTFNGDTATANALDDYEEGTWTPTLGGNTSYTSQAGRYTKIGRYVLADFDLTVNVLGTGSAGTLQGLPFNVENSGGVFSGHVSFYSGLALSVDSLDCYAIANTDDIFFTGHNSGAAASIGNNLAIFQNSTRVLGTVHYFAA